MTDPPAAPDPLTCPLCGGPNGCAKAKASTMANSRAMAAPDTGTAGDAPPACWCYSAVIAPDVLQAVPEALRGRVCICVRCARSASGGPKTATAA